MDFISIAVRIMEAMTAAATIYFAYICVRLVIHKRKIAKQKAASKKRMTTSPISGDKYDPAYRPWATSTRPQRSYPPLRRPDDEYPATQSLPPILTDTDPWPTRYSGDTDNNTPSHHNSSGDDPTHSFGGGSFGGGGGGGSYDSDSSSSSSSSDYGSSDSGSSSDSSSSDSGSSSSDW
jgi:uncharacterized membrane protein YgcG